jgi:hypothetical protein
MVFSNSVFAVIIYVEDKGVFFVEAPKVSFQVFLD